MSLQLRLNGRGALADKIEIATIDRVTFDKEANAGYIYLQPSHKLNDVEKNIVDILHEETLMVDTTYDTYIDIDNFGRMIGIEILATSVIENELRKHAVN